MLKRLGRFVGRARELNYLQRLARKKVASLVVIKGRRRIGKSRLVEEFAQGMTFYHFSGLPPDRNTTAQDQRDEFARQLSDQTHLPPLHFENWHQAFIVLADQIKSGQKIVLLDEISWMGSKDDTFLGQLKNAWDIHYKKNPQLILILCGSVSQWIEKNILSSTGYFGRISQTITLEELPLTDCNQLLDRIGFKGSSYEKLMLLAITGGVPWYIENIQPDLSATENIKQLCFEKGGLLVNEYDKIFHDLFSKRSTVSKQIVDCLVDGPKDRKTISAQISYSEGGTLSDYLDGLVSSGFIAQDTVWSFKTGKSLQLNKYRLRDNYLRFYLRYIAPNHNKIEKGQYENMSILSLPGWESIMGLQFENLVLNNRRLLQLRLGIRPEEIVEDNPFFQNKTTRQKGCQIDYLIQTKHQTLFVFEIKFSKNTLGINLADEMREKISALSVPKGYVCHPILIYVGKISQQLEESDYFYNSLDFNSLLLET